MNIAHNPILRGFNPDPSIIRVGSDYYIATSTFEWFPGVQIHHSRDLVNWQLISRPLSRRSQLDMLGVPDSCGVWAPCLTYDQGTFYLVYSNVRSFDGVWKDTPNFLVTTNDISSDWSEPAFLSASGFDGSLFHDEDGRKWYISMLVDHRKGKFFGGIILQELSTETEKLIGPVYRIFTGTELGCTEGPHLYKRNGYYYLILAEGGTEYGHAVSLARSKTITGPYELHPENPIISARDKPKLALQKTGHADWVETQNGDTYIVFLTGRPLSELGRCTLGRETAIEELDWRVDHWPYLKSGDNSARVEVPVNGLDSYPFPEISERDDFEEEVLNIHFQSLRVPISEDWLSLHFRPGYLRLFGRESLTSFHEQSLIARRIQHFDIMASTCLEFEPKTFQQMAGLVCYYNTSHYCYLNLSGGDKEGEKFLNIVVCDNFSISECLDQPFDLKGINRIYLKAHFKRTTLQFFYATEEGKWREIGPLLDGSILSDDYVREGSNRYRPAFTGAFVGLCCQDLTGRKLHADFDWFEYKEL